MKSQEDLKIKLIELKKQFNNLNTQSTATKLVLNGIYGILGVPYSRYFNVDIAEAISTCGRTTVLKGQDYANELLNNPNENVLSVINEIKGLK